MQTEVENLGNGEEKRKQYKKKDKKKRFLSNAKGFGKQGIYGRGTHLEEDQFTYFINILDSMKTGFESLDDKVTMANNVIEQTVGEEINLSSNQIGSKVIEALIGFTSAEHFERFQTSFSMDLRPLCSDSFASHVIEKLIDISFLRAVGKKSMIPNNSSEPPKKKTKVDLLSEKEYNTTTKFSDEHRKNCSNFILKIGKFLLNNLEDFLWDPHANHIMRTSIFCLGGLHKSKVAFARRNEKLQFDDKYDVPEEWIQIIKEYVERLQLWPHFPDFPYNEFSSTLLASICIALRKNDKNLLKHLGKKILKDAFMKGSSDDCDEKKIDIENENDDKEVVEAEKTSGHDEENQTSDIKLHKVFRNASSVRLLETLLSVAGPKLFTQIYVMLFTGRIKVLALNPDTNFAVQSLLTNIKEKVDFEMIFTEISEHIEEFLRIGHSGVVLALSSACLRLATNQGAFVTALQKALHTGGGGGGGSGSKKKSEDFFKCALKLKPYEIAIEDKTQFVHLHGSLIIQNILQFNKPIFLVNCILGTPPNDLIGIFSTPNGSYIADVFVNSKFIGEKSREKLIRHLEGSYLEMATTTFGSRVLENLFEASSDDQKYKIANELASKINQLKGTMFGRVLCSNLRIETFQLSQSQWKASFDRANKAQKMFKDIVPVK